VISAALRTTLALLAVLALATGCGSILWEQPKRPNIILVLTDDLDVGSIAHMSRLQKYMGDEGTTFEAFFVTTPVCCPSRTTILTGQYAHNHEIFRNSPPEGGFKKFHDLGRESSTIATWLDNAGYRTLLAGKYLNGYCESAAGCEDPRYVPPGWDEWYAHIGKGDWNDNGEIVNERGTNQDDLVSGYATRFVESTENSDDPFFAYLATNAPHPPAKPPARYEDSFEGVKAPRTPSFNEQDVRDKPRAVRNLPPLSQRKIDALDARYRQSLQSMAAVNDMLEDLVAALRKAGKLENTYIFFASDNGYLMGQHRIQKGKNVVYEESIKVPLVVRGPGVPAGGQHSEMVLNNDLAPTFADLAGVKPPDSVDGRSFAPLLDGDRSNDPWRSASEVQSWKKGGDSEGKPNYRAVRTPESLYVEYSSGERELYDLNKDPYQLESVQDDPAYADEKASLRSQLDALKDCAGQECREAENASPGQ